MTKKKNQQSSFRFEGTDIVASQNRVLLENLDNVRLLCIRCREPISAPLARWPLPQISLNGEGAPAIEPRFFWVAPNWFEPEFGVQPGDIVISLESSVRVVPSGNRIGCCGVDGQDGPNLSCPCGLAIGTETSDCWTPRMFTIAQTQIAVREVTDDEAESLDQVISLWESINSSDTLTLALHYASGLDAWFGDDWTSLIMAWASTIKKNTVVVWPDSIISHESGIDLEKIETVFAEAGKKTNLRFTLLLA